MRISARNQLAGQIESIEEGAVNSRIIVKLPGGQSLVAVITKESVENLGLTVGQTVTAVIKASDVMIGVD